MTQMIRKQIYIPKRQQSLLKRRAKARGVSEAALIREAIEDNLRGHPAQSLYPDASAWERALQLMKSLQSLGPLSNQRRTWKREDAYQDRMSRYERRPG
jgi:hypothetical protein